MQHRGVNVFKILTFYETKKLLPFSEEHTYVDESYPLPHILFP